jgi:signal transduction histidine kinase
LLKNVVAGFRRRFAKDMVHIRVECRDHSLSLDGAPNLLQIVLYNLMVNGIESALAAKVAKPRLTLRAHALADRILIEVADNGPGIDPDIASRIFEPFVSSKPLGSGVGLAIAQDIVEWHGGKLSFECNSSRAGTNFRLAMPRRNEIRGDDVLLCSFA